VDTTLAVNTEPAEDGVSASTPEFDAVAENRDVERAFFSVTGMHCGTCEEFLEERAGIQQGVHEASASYVTETVRVEYDPTVVGVDELKDALSVAGYRVTDREHASGEGVTTVLSRETDADTRDLEDLLGYRYIAGVLFGMFIMLPYIVVLYPYQLSELVGGPLQGFEGNAIESGLILLLPLFAGTTGVVVFFTGLPLLRGAYVSIRMHQPNTDLLAAITLVTAYVYSILALLGGHLNMYFDLVIFVGATVVAAIFYESLVKQRVMARLTDLTVSQTDEAKLCLPTETASVAVEDLRPDDRVLVGQGERVPVDGTLTEGTCTVDESVVTGESLPVVKAGGDTLVGGSVVTDGAAVIRVGDPPTSSIDRLTTAVWLLQSATHGLQRTTDRLAARLVPVLAVAAVVAGVVALALGSGLAGSLLAVFTVVLVACPWGLALSTPLSVATNLQAAMARGIVVFDETVFERVRETDVVVFDKTGTLTSGEMVVRSAEAPEDVLVAVAELERRAAHPVASALTAAFASDETDERVTAFESHGLGVGGTVDDSEYLAGHPDLFVEQGWHLSESIRQRVDGARERGRLPVVVGRDGEAAGIVVLSDEPREGWESVLARLGEQDVDVVVLTGDEEVATRAFRAHSAVTAVFAGIPPEGKTETVRRLQADQRVTMVGDGTNDAPALAQADLGISLGSGTALASDAADLAIAEDELAVVETVFDLARGAGRRVRQNTALALSFNVLVAVAALLGVLNPLVVMAAAVIMASLVAGNAHRER